MATKEDIEELKKMIKDLKKEFKGLVEIQQRLIHERLGVPPPQPPVEYGEDNSKKKSSTINISNYESDKIEVSGNTFSCKDVIKSCGAKFNGTNKSWILSIESLDKLIGEFKKLKMEEDKDFVNNVKIPETNDSGGFGDL